MLKPGEMREGERPELVTLDGPFAGIQSEMPSYKIEKFSGFADVTNILFRKGSATTRPTFTALTAIPAPAEPIMAVADFYDSSGTRFQVVVTPTRLLEWNGATNSWTVIGGAALTGTASNLFTWDVVGHRLCFCQGTDKVKIWSGTGNCIDAAAAAVPARFLGEIANHLLAGYTTDAGTTYPQRVHWTGNNDPTDWTSFNAGSLDLNNNFGPITGIRKLYQSGHIYQSKGIVQVVPTGLGTTPFAFPSLSSHARGNFYPYSLDLYDESNSVYAGEDNVYMFNGTQSVPIGDFPISGSRIRLGARKRILTDLQSVDRLTVIGKVVVSINGNDYPTYWLFIPNASVWVFNFDEGNWTRFTFSGSIKTAGDFVKSGIIRIADLIGNILSQNWTPATLVGTNPLDGFAIGFSDGTVGYIDFTGITEQPWTVLGPQQPLGDLRHEKTVNAYRLAMTDIGQTTFTLTVNNEKGETRTKTVTTGTGIGTNSVLIIRLPAQITGMFITAKLSGAAGQPISFSELTPLYVVGGEYKANVA